MLTEQKEHLQMPTMKPTRRSHTHVQRDEDYMMRDNNNHT